MDDFEGSNINTEMSWKMIYNKMVSEKAVEGTRNGSVVWQRTKIGFYPPPLYPDKGLLRLYIYILVNSYWNISFRFYCIISGIVFVFV